MSSKQQIEGSHNFQIGTLNGNIVIGASQHTEQATAEVVTEPKPITKEQAAVIMNLVKAIDALDSAQGRDSERALMFYIANKTAGLSKDQTYKDITVDKYPEAIEALHQHIRKRKLKGA